MSVDSPPGLPSDVAALLARADAAGRGAERYLAATIDDLFLPDEYRLDDRTRARLGLLLRSTIVAIGADLHARCWAQRGAAPGNSFEAAPLIARLAASDALRDPELIGELLDRTRQDLLGEALRANRPPGAQMPLLSRLVEGRDQAVAAAARSYRLAESRSAAGDAGAGELLTPAMGLRAAWLVAAALRPTFQAEGRDADRLIVAAVEQHLLARDEAASLERCAAELARMIDREPSDPATMLVDALDDGSVALFVAMLARRMAVAPRIVGALTLEPGGHRLWLALRSLDIGRAAIARIGYLLAEADPRRDLEAFGALLDTIAAVPAAAARDALADLALPPAYRAAIAAVEGGPRP